MYIKEKNTEKALKTTQNHPDLIFFQKPIEAELARKFGNALLNKGAESVNLKSFRFYDRMLPMQNHLPAGGLGNLIALPLQGQALKEGNSAFVDEHWNF